MTSTCKLKFLPALALAATFAGPSHADTNQVRVAWYGGNWGDAFKMCIADPFTKKTGIRVIPEIGTSNTTLAKLRQQKDKPTIDVAFLDGGISELAESEGVLAPITQAAIPNLANLKPQGVYKAGNDIFAVSAGYYSLGITYNKKEIHTPPTSWNDLWNSAYKGAVVIPSPANSAGVPFVAFLADIWKVPLDNLGPIYKKLHALDVASYFDSSGAASNAFQSGEAVIGAHFSVGAWGLADKGLPIGFAVPKEGVWATDARLHLVKNAPDAANGAKFINQALTPESSKCLAENLYLGPAIKGVDVDKAVAMKMPWGVGGSIANLNLLDWSVINKQRAAITSAWNREVAGK